MIEIFQLIFALSLQMGILIGIVLLVRYFGKKPYMAAGRYFLWLVVALRLLIPINLEWVNLGQLGESVQSQNYIYSQESIGRETVKKENSVDSQTPGKALQKKQAAKIEAGSNPINKENRLENRNSPKKEKAEIWNNVKNRFNYEENTIWAVFSIVWLIGAVSMAGYEVILYQSVYKSIRRWRRPAPKEYQQQLTLVCQEMHITKKIPVYQCRKVASPMIVGFCQPSIILPEREYQKESLYYIYRHELTHFCHGDLYYKLIQTMVRCIYWFHPLIHAMYRQAAFDVELVCDEKVIKNQSEAFRREYSFALLDTLTAQNQRTFPLSTYFFNGGRDQMKERFKRIMVQNKKKYGIGLFGLLIVCAVILGNVSLHPKTDTDVSNPEAAQEGTGASKKSETKLSEKKLTKTKNILVVGQENIGNSNIMRADMVLLVTLQPQEKKCYVTEIARDLVMNYDKDILEKVSGTYAKHGMDNFKKAMEKQTGLTIDSTIEVNFQQFEDIIDSVGGIEINLTKKEADYLKRTNYIREETYRNVKEGKQLLNGQQALGYARVRRVKSSNGQDSTFGRGERALNIVSAMVQKMKDMDGKDWISTASDMYKMVKTSQLDMETVYQIMQAVLIDGYAFETQQIPEKDSYTCEIGDMGQYMEYDYSSSTTLQKLKGIKVISENEDGKKLSYSSDKKKFVY